MEGGTAPGIDGLPVEFYKAFWAELGADWLAVLNEALVEGSLPLSCRRAVITLLPKKGDLLRIGDHVLENGSTRRIQLNSDVAHVRHSTLVAEQVACREGQEEVEELAQMAMYNLNAVDAAELEEVHRGQRERSESALKGDREHLESALKEEREQNHAEKDRRKWRSSSKWRSHRDAVDAAELEEVHRGQRERSESALKGDREHLESALKEEREQNVAMRSCLEELQEENCLLKSTILNVKMEMLNERDRWRAEKEEVMREKELVEGMAVVAMSLRDLEIEKT
ncbi:hypothetical protein AOLI_G00004290 [Acnodon oligacanthus]